MFRRDYFPTYGDAGRQTHVENTGIFVGVNRTHRYPNLRISFGAWPRLREELWRAHGDRGISKRATFELATISRRAKLHRLCFSFPNDVTRRPSWYSFGSLRFNSRVRSVEKYCKYAKRAYFKYTILTFDRLICIGKRHVNVCSARSNRWDR